MFQDKLLRTLWTQDDPEVIMNRLEVEDFSESMTEPVRELDQHMLALAAKLAKQWSIKAE